MRATLDDVLCFVREMSDVAHARGYMLAVYGSTIMKESGRDVDVFAIPWRHPVHYHDLLTALAGRGYVELSERYFGFQGTCSVVLCKSNTRPAIDLQIREVGER